MDSVQDVKTEKFSPTKRLKISLQLEKVNVDKKKFFGQLKLVLNDYAANGSYQTLAKELSKPTVSPSPLIRLAIKTTWISIDGVLLESAHEIPKRIISSKGSIDDEAASLMSDNGQSDSEIEFTCDVCDFFLFLFIFLFLNLIWFN